MNCEKYEKNISAFVDGELNDSELEMTQTHINECDSCQNTINTTRAVKKLLSEKNHREVAPVNLRARIRRELDRESAKSPIWGWLRSIFIYHPIPAYAVAAIVLLVIGIGIDRLTFPHPISPNIIFQQSENGQAITLSGSLVCINCALHGEEGHPVFCKEHNHILGIRLADGTIWSIMEGEQASHLRSRYADMKKHLSIEGVAFPRAHYIELRSFKFI